MVLSSSNTPRLFIITDRKDEKELQLSPNDQDWEGKLVLPWIYIRSTTSVQLTVY